MNDHIEEDQEKFDSIKTDVTTLKNDMSWIKKAMSVIGLTSTATFLGMLYQLLRVH